MLASVLHTIFSFEKSLEKNEFIHRYTYEKQFQRNISNETQLSKRKFHLTDLHNHMLINYTCQDFYQKLNFSFGFSSILNPILRSA